MRTESKHAPRKRIDRGIYRRDRDELVKPKTLQAVRAVVLTPALARVLREHRRQALQRGVASREDFVFTSSTGGPLHYRNVVRRGLDVAVERACLHAEPRLRFHDLRDTFASLLIAAGVNVVFVPRQLGHADPSITLRFYAHLFDRAEHAQRATNALEAVFGKALVSGGGNGRENRNIAAAGEIVRLQRVENDENRSEREAPL